MTRAIWKGQIAFGLVHIPVALFPAQRRQGTPFNQLDSRDNTRIRYKRVNAATGEEVPWDRIVRGYNYEDDRYIILNDEDLKRIARDRTHTCGSRLYPADGRH